MQAVRLARYHTRRSHVVRFCGAYHGWWDGVQPGVGNPRPAHEVYTLKDMDATHAARARDAQRHRLRAGEPDPGDAPQRRRAERLDARRQRAQRPTSTAPPTRAWLATAPRRSARERGIALIFDEVFLGFRLALRRRAGVLRRARRHGDLRQDAGRRPAGRRRSAARTSSMRRFRDDRPADICFARGTFNSHPYVMATMNEFLQPPRRRPRCAALYGDLDARVERRARARSTRGSQRAALPVRVANMTVGLDRCSTRSPGRYNWMFQYYLRAEGLSLSWIGTGRFIFSHNYTRRGFRGRRGPLRRRRAGDAAGRLVVGRSRRHQQGDPPQAS